MSAALSYPLNPVDNVLLATHESLRLRGYCGLGVMLIADLEGEICQSEVAEAVRELGRRYPALSAHIRYTGVLGHAYWHIPADPQLENAIEYEYVRLSGGSEDATTWFQQAINDTVDPAHGPQLRLMHVDMGNGRHRMGLRWAHPLMDVEGGYLLFNELHAVLCGREPTLGTDPRTAAARPFNCTIRKSFARTWRGILRHDKFTRYHQPRIVKKQDFAARNCNILIRVFDAEQRGAFEALAKQRCTPGPLLYSRALMIGIARAYLKMATARGRPREHYLFSQSLPLPRQGPRPGLHGNYVTVPWIVFKAAELGDWATADKAAVRQLKEYHEKSYDHAMWELYRATTLWPRAMTRKLVTHRVARGAACCSNYRFPNDLDHMGRAKIVNLYALASANCHPGWLVLYSTFRKSMTLSLTFFEDYMDPQTASDFMDCLREEILPAEAIPRSNRGIECKASWG